MGMLVSPQAAPVLDLTRTWPAFGEVQVPAEPATTRKGVWPSVEPYDSPQYSSESPAHWLPPRAARLPLTTPLLFFQVSVSIRSGSLGRSVVELPNWRWNLPVVTVWVFVLILRLSGAGPVAVTGVRISPVATISAPAFSRVRVVVSNLLPL